MRVASLLCRVPAVATTQGVACSCCGAGSFVAPVEVGVIAEFSKKRPISSVLDFEVERAGVQLT